MNGLTMKHIRYFDALARCGHFGHAAEECAISQPALSMQIKELESLVGAPLVERTARSVRLTPLGTEFSERTQEILRVVDELGDLARTAHGPLTGRLRVGIIPTLAPYLLPQLMQTITNRYPALEVRPREAMTHALLDDLRAARLDVAIVALPVSEPSLREFALFEEDFVLVRPEADADKPVPSAKHLSEMRLLLLEEGHCFRDQALSFCKMSGSEPRSLFEGSSLTTLVQMVSAGIGITLIPELALPLETRTANVSLARFPAPTPSRTVGMVWRKSTPLSDELMQIGGIVRAVGKSLI